MRELLAVHALWRLHGVRAMLNASAIADEEILAEYNSDLDVWSVGSTLPDGTYVGCGCATEAEVPGAKEQVRARCAELLVTDHSEERRP